METLTKDALFHIATMLDLDNLLSLCSSNSRFNILICQQNAIWLYKLNNEFPDWKQHFNDRPVRKVYSLLVRLSKLRKEMKYEGSIYQLYREMNLDLSDRNIKTLPPEIGSLTNLQELYLYINRIETLPPEIGSLSNLQRLYLFNNQIKTLPPEIGSLSNLRVLYLSNNQIVTLPAEIGLLSNLQELSLYNNQIKTLPPELGSLSNLQVLYLYGNEIKTLPPEIGSLTNLQVLWLDKKVKDIPNNLKNVVRYT